MIKKMREMKENPYKLYTVLFLLFGCIIFAALLIRHNSFVATGDCFNQYYPILTYLASYYRELLPNLLHGKLIMYSTTIGFGDDICGALNWFGFGDVFTILAAFVPVRFMSYAFTFITLLRFYLAGMAFILYGRYKKMCAPQLVLGALMYSYSFYALGLGLIAFSFPTVMVYFPLIILGIDRIVEGQKEQNWKISCFLIVVLFLQALCGFYFLYMDILACIVYFALRSIGELIYRNITLRECLRSAWRISVHFAVGIGLAGVVIIPVLAEYFQCLRQGDSRLSWSSFLQLPDSETIRVALKNIITPASSGYEAGLCISILSVPVIIFVVMHCRERKYRNRLLFCILALYGYFFPTIGLIANGFAYSTNRWIYIFCFFMSYMTAATYTEVVEQMCAIEKWFYFASFLLWLLSALRLNTLGNGMLLRLIMYATIWILTFIFIQFIQKASDEKKKRKGYRALWCLAVCNILLSGFLFMAPVKLGGSGVGASFKGLNFVHQEIYDAKLFSEAGAQTQSGLNRYDINDTSLDAPLMLGVNSTYLYYSMCNGSIFRIFNELRISPGIMHTYLLQGLDSRQIMESLLSVRKYAVDTESNQAVQNEYYLPIGFTYQNAVSEHAVESLSQLQKMNLMMTHMIVEDRYMESAQEKALVDYNEQTDTGKQRSIPIQVTYGSGIERNGNVLEVAEGAAIHLRFEPVRSTEPGSELYLYLRNMTSNPSFKADINLAGKLIRVRAKKDEWYYQNDFDYLVQVQNVAAVGKIDIVFQEAGEYTLDGLELVQNSDKGFTDQYKALSKDTLQNVDMDRNSISGNMSLDNGKWMFISLPYSKGWKCRIDDVNVDIVRANYSFMAVYVPAGNHRIVFDYVSPGIRTGLILSILSGCVFVLMIIAKKRKKRADD